MYKYQNMRKNPLQYPDSGKLSTDVPDVDTGIDWLVYLARYSQQCQAQSHFVVRSRLDIVENTEIMVGPNQSFYCGTLRPDCRPFRTGIFRLFISGFFPAFRCIRREMGLVFVQHTADHTFIDQDRLRCSRRREDQFGAGIGFPFRYGRTDTLDTGKHKIIQYT